MKFPVAVFALVALLASPIRAQSSASPSTLITVSGQELFRIRAGAGGYTAAQRAEQVRERLIPILSLQNLRPADVTIRQVRPGQDASIYVRGQLLVTVDRTLAAATQSNPSALAGHWADRLRAVLPSVSVHSDR